MDYQIYRRIAFDEISLHNGELYRDVTGEMNSAISSLSPTLTYNDTVIFSFAEGEFVIHDPINMPCNVVIIGRGKESTKMTINNQTEYSLDDIYPDSFLYCHGGKDHKIKVLISDIEISLAEHSDIWWSETIDGKSQAKYLISIRHADSVEIRNVKSRCLNAYCTNIDMRMCSNVCVSFCELINYNNCINGGILWLRRDTRNVVIAHNRFVKYGNDEIFAFWLPGDDERDGYVPPSGVKENIIIVDNDITYEKPVGAADLIAGVQISLYNNDDGSNEIPITFSNFRFIDNHVTVSAPIRNLIGLRFGPNDSHDNIVIGHNSITCTASSAAQDSQFWMFQIKDETAAPSFIEVYRNIISVDAYTIGPGGYCYCYLFYMEGGYVNATGNIYTGTYAKIDGYSMGMTLLYAQSGVVTLNLTGNEFIGINKIASCKDSFTLVAYGNTFNGDTRVYCNGVSDMSLTFTSNKFISQCYEMLLQEAARWSNLVFNDNDVSIYYQTNNQQYAGTLFAHYNDQAITSMLFLNFEVTGNTVRGTTPAIWIPSGILCSIYTVSGNTYYNSPS